MPIVKKNKITFVKWRKSGTYTFFLKTQSFRIIAEINKVFPSKSKSRSNVCSVNTNSECLVKENEITL